MNRFRRTTTFLAVAATALLAGCVVYDTPGPVYQAPPGVYAAPYAYYYSGPASRHGYRSRHGRRHWR
jgi:hypothetical protein